MSAPDPSSPEWKLYWRQQINDAQRQEFYERQEQRFKRIRYGAEGIDVEAGQQCHDCDIKKGQLHVPGCDMERCPRCGSQLISCGCFDYPEQE